MDKAAKGWRGPPAFQMYASDRLAHRNFRMMTLEERGLLHTIELECWVNKNVPTLLPELARTLGLEVADIQSALTERVRGYLQVVDEPMTCMVCPDLERYRAELDAKHEAQSKGGKKGADGRWRKQDDGLGSGLAHGQADGSLRGAELKGEEQKGARNKEHEEFVKAMEGDPDFLQRKDAGQLK